jgi:hypothetical protein
MPRRTKSEVIVQYVIALPPSSAGADQLTWSERTARWSSFPRRSRQERREGQLHLVYLIRSGFICRDIE